MSGCARAFEVGRRRFLSGAGLAAAGATFAVAGHESTLARPALARVTYPSMRLASLKDFLGTEPFAVAYPDGDAPGMIFKFGTPVEGGVGPDHDIVGFSTVCPHKGFPLAYRTSHRTLNCPGHYSVFDCEKGGQQVWGHATQNLPQYRLRIDAKGDIYAEGIDELLYGRLSNVLEG